MTYITSSFREQNVGYNLNFVIGSGFDFLFFKTVFSGGEIGFMCKNMV